MLTMLRIKNLALAGNTRVEFKPGLNVITGETGAGKSILIGALGLVLGNRADKGMIRSGEDACGAEAVFELEDTSTIDAILEKYGLEPCEDGQLVIRRIVKAAGSARNIINDSPVKLPVLKEIGKQLVDIHGPHDHQSLLSQDTQLDMLDAFGQLSEVRKEYHKVYAELHQLQEHRDALDDAEEGIEERMDVLSYRISEIEEAELTEEEEEEILREHDLLGHAQQIQEHAGSVIAALSDGESNAFDLLASAHHGLESIARIIPQGEEWLTQLSDASSLLQELSTDINGVVQDIDADPERLDWLDSRMALYKKLRKKYGPEISDVLAKLEDDQRQLRDLSSRGERLEELERNIEQQLRHVQSAGEQLTLLRRDSADQLAKAVQIELGHLGLQKSRFSIAFEASKPRPSGCDVIEFEFAPNVGEAIHPLRQIASSGEMSRVMLATKTVLARHDRIPLMVFDEIDANVGGETAGAVGRKIAELGESHQVICITHFPQVAACGSAHFAVSKFEKDGRTYSDVIPLDDDQRVNEIARMLGGAELTSVTTDHARELLQRGA